ncbi:MAG: Phospho-N-acetylmuramoyl-pentapeptide-transferase [Microgenomates group bacterium GW2011_GWC1_39_7b]|uniref:Phospho-N-acetylmuramoyl-pentapeptide-transferase n=3 Tax=Candidatus Woeseibacteriota TaxID=1752722 RepID=A0A0G0P0X6_9BACT|nr:MAG: Phospho-N-acetylmuramoyl-pentapeptide-transferase [Candidatus Woesebacteria bacterium GW2011_GWB1_39_10]KKR26872.1 MAG: Phospho-N-acetylmuramoyl-pentapeptide-transferase [Microgenomates group bacterium GW2011_GWC1_39_7b]KKR74353.1 MAG: Phospho-N-acetylmuramoyl-pentapeptide-transferase [Candidatus Woesebacteria bacterium GW2011_GWA2_40_7]KKS90736.1 MAG: Phospho-N-acetylmuramoyl-pentapeptide-transferase [Candidatus Woesebacteria bacterium GW2011_GWA1_43_12]
MTTPNLLPLGLGLIIFSFLISFVLIVPYIGLLYKLKLTRRREAPKSGKVPLFDKLHDTKTGTPVGGGVFIIFLVTLFFAILFPLSSRLGVYIKTSYPLRGELFIIFFTFLSFGLLGLLDDILKIFARPTKGVLGLWFGLRRWQKFILQWILGLTVGFFIYQDLGIHIVNIPLLHVVYDLGVWYIPFAAFMLVAFSNAFNVTDGLDGLASGLLIICLAAFGVIIAGHLDTPLSLFVALWLGSLFAFLYFNIWPARIFLGDSGALSFGASLAVIGLLSGSIIALLVMGGIFVIELTSSAIQIVGWKVLKKPIFPLAPIHHTFLAVGWEEPKIVMRAWLLGILLAIFGLWLATI